MMDYSLLIGVHKMTDEDDLYAYISSLLIEMYLEFLLVVGILLGASRAS